MSLKAVKAKVMEKSSAFTPFTRLEKAEAQPLVHPGPYSFLVQATAGIRAWCRPKLVAAEKDDLQRQRMFYVHGGTSAFCPDSVFEGG